MNEVILKCSNINKIINKKHILKNVSFEINKSDIFGIVGPNGAGKTTIIKSILSFQKINSGNIFIDNEINSNKSMEKIGAVVENPMFYNYLSGFMNLRLKANLFNNITDEDIYNIVKIVNLENKINDKVYKYSLGMIKRLAIAESLLNNPKLLILDEPTNGLDINGIKGLKILLKDLSKKGVAILISSHALGELSNFCNKICIINNGKVIDILDLNKIKESPCYLIEVDNTENINLLFKNEIIDSNNIKVWCNKEFIPLIIESLINSNIKIYSVKNEDISIENTLLEKLGGL